MSQPASESAEELADSCYEAAHAMPRPEAMRFIAGLVDARTAEAVKVVARRHCARCAEDCEDAMQCADGYLCPEQLAVFGPERAAILGEGKA